MKNPVIVLALLTILITVSTFSNTYSQNNQIALRVNAGTNTSAKLIDGYYYSFDIGVPVTKYFEIAPTFTSASAAPKTSIHFSYQDHGEQVLYSYGIPSKGLPSERLQADIYNSVGVVLYAKPLVFLQEMLPKWNRKRELLIGGGIAYDHYTRTYANYEKLGSDYKMIYFNQKMVTGFSPIYAKIAYNYYFKENAFAGVITTVNGFDGDGALLIGIQLGARI